MHVSFQEETLQFLKEEKTDDAIYSIYLKKVNYHSSLLDRKGSVRTRSREKATDAVNATLSSDLLVSSIIQIFTVQNCYHLLSWR